MSTGRATRSQVKRAPVRKGSRRASAQRRSQRGPSGIDRLIARMPGGAAGVQRALHWTVGTVAVVGAAMAAHLLGVTAWAHERWADAVADAGFRVARVEVVGADRIDRLKVYDIALAQRDRSMASIDLDALRARLMQYGWIAEARVSRRLPDTLVIDIVERTPAAVWQHNRRLALIDADGVVLEPVGPDRARGLPLVIGPGANRQSKALETLLDQAPALRPLLSGATWVGNRRWDLRFRSGELLSLPEGEEASAKALVSFARMDGVNRLLGRGIVRFDMRDPTRFVLRLPSEGRVDTMPGGGAAADEDAPTVADSAGEDAARPSAAAGIDPARASTSRAV